MSCAAQRTTWLVVAVLLASLALRVTFVVAVPAPPPTEDAARYDMAARRILAGRGFAYPLDRYTAAPATGARFERFLATRPNAYTMPGLAYFLAGLWAVTGQGAARWLAARLANCALATASLLLLYLIARRVVGRRAAMVALIAAALFAPFVWVVDYLLTETLFVTLLLAWVLATLVALRKDRWPWFAVAGALLGVTTLVRPTAIVWVACVAVWMLVSKRYAARRFLAMAGVTALAFCVVMTPWWARNTARYGHPVWLTTTGASPVAAATSPEYRAGGRPIAPYPTGDTDDEQLGRYWTAAAERQIADIARTGPLAYVRVKLANTRYALLHPWPPPPAVFARTARVSGWYWYAIMALAVVGIVARRRDALFWLVVSLPAVIFLTYFVTLILDRYLHPVQWLAFVPAGAGAVAIGRWATRRARSEADRRPARS